MKTKISISVQPKANNNKKKLTDNNSNNRRNFIVVPDIRGLSKSIRNISKKYGIQVYFQGGRTFKCNEEDIGESARTFGKRFKEHLKAPSPIYNYCNTTGHTTSHENFSIVGREDQTS